MTLALPLLTNPASAEEDEATSSETGHGGALGTSPRNGRSKKAYCIPRKKQKSRYYLCTVRRKSELLGGVL